VCTLIDWGDPIQRVAVRAVFLTSTSMGRGLSGLITVLEDKQYMVTVREKMNNIKKVAKFYNYDFLHTGK